MSVVIPNWNGRALLEVCLPSLARQTFTAFETIVVDNGSSDDSVAWLARNHPDARLVVFAENRGFAAAANAGIRTARGEIIVLLNNDTEVDAAWLTELVRAFDGDAGIAFCASRVLNFHERTLIDSAGDMLGPLAYQIGHGQPDGPPFDEPRRVLSACAAAAAYRRDLLDQIGLFDERFVSYLEDVDLGIRAQYAGRPCLYVPDAIVYHMVSATSRRISHTRLRLLLRNSLFLFFQYMPPRVLLPWGPIMLAWPFVYVIRERQPIRIALAAVAGLLRHAPDVLRRRRAVRSGRSITDREFCDLLAPPFGSASLPAASRARRTA